MVFLFSDSSEIQSTCWVSIVLLDVLILHITHTRTLMRSASHVRIATTEQQWEKRNCFLQILFSAHLWFLCQINAAALAGVNGFFSLRKWECAANELHTHIQFGTNFKPIPSMIFKIVCLQFGSLLLHKLLHFANILMRNRIANQRATMVAAAAPAHFN